MWRLIPGKLNPSDLATRDVMPKELNNSAWWNGPSFLKSLDETDSPRREHQDNPIAQTEARKQKPKCFAAVHTIDSSILSKFSSLWTLINVVAYC